MTVVSLSLHRFGPVADRLWVFAQMGAARLTLPRVPGIGFWKLCGSGVGQGFTPIPNTAVWAILATWPDLATAQARTAEARPFASWAARAEEDWTVFLSPTSCRGAWSGHRPFPPSGQANRASTRPADALPDGAQTDDAPTDDAEPTKSGPSSQRPIAALTRATVRPRAARRFWARSPAISDAIGADPNVALKIGIGEVPWIQQVTFSIWPDAESMAAFARAPDGPHARAIQAVRQGGWFREELYARFRPLAERGTWEGRRPLADLAQRTTAPNTDAPGPPRRATPGPSSCSKYPGGPGAGPRSDARPADRPLVEETAP